MSESPPAAADAANEIDMSGRDLAGYRLLRRLGRGAMAEVYLATQLSLGRQVAVKVLKTNLAHDATYVQRFHQEARAAAGLVHANIVQIHEVGNAGGVHFIAQEYVQGLNLAEFLARRGSPDLARVLDIARQVAAALNKAAEQGIVHRDIKPENIMLAASGEVKVADFGLARLYGQETALNLTQAGITMGTPLYMSPEQIEGRPLDPRSDIYSLGVTCYQMLAGEPPFRGETVLSVALQHLSAEPRRLEHLRPDLPDGVSRVVHKMLAKDVKRRYANARELLHDLRSVSIELFGDDPLGDFPGWGGDELLSMVEARREATRRLGAAMKTSAVSTVRRKRIGRWALVVGSLLLGLALAWTTRARPLVSGAVEDDESVSAHDTAEAQYIYALMVNTEAGWKSVPKNFPNDKTYARRAMEGLALLYLEKLDYARAMQIFSEFASLNDAEVQFKSFGLAGQAIVLNREGKFAESADKLAALWPLHENLDREMTSLVRHTLQSNRKALRDSRSLSDWNKWFEQSERSPAPAGEPTGGR